MNQSAPLATASLTGAQRAARAVRMFSNFIRFTYFGSTAILPLLGAASVDRRVPGGMIVSLLLAALIYHAYAYIVNDIVDLPLDRHEPSRVEFPLVMGVISRTQAGVIAALLIPITFGLTALMGGNGLSYAALAAAFVVMTAYDLWSKYNPFPPLTDLSQALGWGFLVYYGAGFQPGAPNGLTASLFIYTTIIGVIINGIHGTLRDLPNDLAHGMNTTTIMMGARPGPNNTLLLSRGLIWYTLALHVASLVAIWVPLAANWLHYDSGAWWATVVALGLVSALSTFLLVHGGRSLATPDVMMWAGMLQIVLMVMSMVVLCALYVSPVLLVILIAGYLVPLLPSGLFRSASRWASRLGRLGDSASAQPEA